jgi:superfamily I DNA/RNA helicase
MIEDERSKMYHHIVVDEGQDFSPMMLKSLIAAVPTDGSFIFFGDVAQQIYGSRLSWRDAGIRIKSNEIYRFSDNYRNSPEIVDFATDLTNSPFWESTEDLVRPSSTRANGPKPLLVSFSDTNNEVTWVVDTAIKLSRTSSNVIIVRDRKQVNYFISLCQIQGLHAQEIYGKMKAFSSANGISVTTFHSAKGLEFENVFIPFLSDDNFPDSSKLKSMSEESLCSDEMKLLYVAVTRARHGLYMSYHGILTRLFPAELTNYQFEEM